MPRHRTDLTGNRYSRWIVLAFAEVGKQHESRWLCRCDCGVERVVAGPDLTRGRSRSCGCLTREATSSRSTKHGHANTRGLPPTRTYQTWASMLSRCRDPGNPEFFRYGERGIVVCDRWHEFANFLADMGERPAGKTIDRFPDQNGNYEQGNCRWATPIEQGRNTRANRIITFNGESRCLTEWAETIGICPSTLHGRLKRGWTLQRALTAARNT